MANSKQKRLKKAQAAAERKYDKRFQQSRNFRRDAEIVDTADRAMGRKGNLPNNPEWYNKYPQLVNDVASYPNAVPLGSRIRKAFTANMGTDTFTGGNETLPGIMRIGYVPAISVSDSEQSPINVATRNLYSFVRHANSGHSNYDAPDLMMYIMAMDSMYSTYFYCRRLYGLLRVYNVLNYTYPQLIFEALGANYADLQTNMADFRAFINTMAVKLGSLCVPVGMSIFQRHAFMNEGVYVDGTSSRAQSYVFVPDALYVYSNTGSTGTKLTLTPFTTTVQRSGTGNNNVNVVNSNFTLAQLKSYFDTQFTAVMGDEDFNIMSGDILKAFGSENILKMELISEDFTVLPQYSEEILTQIENATCFGPITSGVITQDPQVNNGAILSSYEGDLMLNTTLDCSGMIDVFGSSKLMNFHHDSVTPEQLMSATALTTSVASNESGYNCAFTVTACGADIPTFMTIYTRTGPSSRMVQQVTYAYNAYGNASMALPVLLSYAQFDWAPHVWPIIANGGTAERIWLPLSDLENAFAVEDTDLEDIHTVRMNSLFYVPQMGFMIK